MEPKQASPATLQALVTNAEGMISELYQSVKNNIKYLEELQTDGSFNQISIIIQQLRIAVEYSLMDIAVSLRAAIDTNINYEKRYHLKNLQASISESYKCIINFEKSRKKSIWVRLGTEIKNNPELEIDAIYDEITQKLVCFGENGIDKNLRDITLHYGENLIEVYRATVLVNDEDKVYLKTCGYMAIIHGILNLINIIESHFDIGPKTQLPVPESDGINDTFKSLINNGDKLNDSVAKILQEADKRLDFLAKHYNNFCRIESYINSLPLDSVSIPEIMNVKAMLNWELLFGFMTVDLAAVIKAYLESQSTEEYKMNLRRLVVVKTSLLVHLYGYNKQEHENSIWARLKELVPTSESALLSESQEIEEILKKITSDSSAKGVRAVYVHLVDNSNSKFSLPATIEAIEKINPIEEVVHANFMLTLTKRVHNFTSNLMEALAEKAKSDRENSCREIEQLFGKLENQIKLLPFPEEDKLKLLQSFFSTKEKICSMDIMFNVDSIDKNV